MQRGDRPVSSRTLCRCAASWNGRRCGAFGGHRPRAFARAESPRRFRRALRPMTPRSGKGCARKRFDGLGRTKPGALTRQKSGQMCLQAFCFGDFHLCQQMKVTRHAGPSPGAVLQAQDASVAALLQAQEELVATLLQAQEKPLAALLQAQAKRAPKERHLGPLPGLIRGTAKP